MFKNPFSFDGRIRRTEFVITGLIFILGYLILLGIIMAGASIMAIGFIPLLWFLWAQGAKRCHDRGNSGWYQIIPFYGFVLLFGDGDIGNNEYGLNPKGIGNQSANV